MNATTDQPAGIIKLDNFKSASQTHISLNQKGQFLYSKLSKLTKDIVRIFSQNDQYASSTKALPPSVSTGQGSVSLEDPLEDECIAGSLEGNMD